ncbi:uncharacterized protein TOT_010001233 [Theileria orientalis strain Shintoku]|uniref:RRM domain-containing protein n=1 Tax=Theileria orientalis strain Shintoku TaxID=869250 RepID=J7MGV3_THEOR|nr:uncharacterized protein TOT_010001233 [Theileria orientalis strain Shintoku]PVC52387.1 hypothetical protein MACL_00000885 [Theileria orientalis]BAM38796.1 uncharacterized protein TOT_010001233 [Theileria orientalis strain Shintoku]|eukprot:XP_009689097.1 uncharacterized protein TOT_010001233 [Theileria orientalis strain Shintoku]
MTDSSIDNYQCYIGCLHHSIGDEEFLTLAKCFSTNVVCSKIVRSQSSSTHLGYGFVQYTDHHSSDEAIILMQGVYAKGFPLVVRSTSNYTSSFDNEQPQSTTNTTVHVSNLSDDTTKEEVMDLAKRFGDVESINMVTDRTISCFWALHSNEPKSYDRKLIDKEREDEVNTL